MTQSRVGMTRLLDDFHPHSSVVDN
jgi:hypothetical protein